jgi:hypothetical protein
MPFFRGTGKTGSRQQHEWRGGKQRQYHSKDPDTQENKSQDAK